VLVEGSRWIVVALDRDRREPICRLAGGSRACRRFRARRILKVEPAELTLSAELAVENGPQRVGGE
jgi:hypothetical protein